MRADEVHAKTEKQISSECCFMRREDGLLM
jgi:hypothetical protein